MSAAIGESHRRLGISELVQIDRYFWNLVFETSIRDELAIQNAMGRSLAGYRVMIELLPESASFVRPEDKQSIPEEPHPKNKTPTKIKTMLKTPEKENIGPKGN